MNAKKHQLICRTCLKVINDNELYTSAETRTNCGAVIDILETCVSELNFDLTHEVLLCCNCFTMLRIAYDFKLKCMNTEEKVFTYLQRHNLPLSDKIHLADVITDAKENNDIEKGDINEPNTRTTNDYLENYITDSSLLHIASEIAYRGRGNNNKPTANTTGSKFSAQLNANMNRPNEYSVMMFNNEPSLSRVANDNCSINSLINADCNIVLKNSNLISEEEECFDSIFYE